MDALITLSAQDGNLSSVPEEIKILPLGKVSSRKGTFLVDDKSVDMILKDFRGRKLDLVVDYEHQTLMNIQAPAGGWIKDLYRGPDAIVAKVEWTPKAQEYLKNREYRYLSPVIKVQKDGRVSSIQSVALTNTPAIDGMFAMCKDGEYMDDIGEMKGENEMELKKLAAILGLPEEATEDDVINTVKVVMEKALKCDEKALDANAGGEVVANSTIMSLLELPDNASTAEVTSKIMTLKNGDVQLAMRVKQLEDAAKEKDADSLVMAALKDGKITAAQKDWAKTYAMKDKEGFESFLKMTTPSVQMGKMDLKDAKTEPQVSDQMEMILKNTGITKEDVEKYGNKEVVL